MTEGNHSGEGVWIASPARTALSEAKHIYWFESASEAMAYYQLHQAKNQELRKAVFVSTGGEPTEKQMRGVLELTIPARQHICFDTGREGWKFAQTLQKEIPYRTAMIWTKENFICCPKAACKRAAYDSMPNGKKPYQ